MDSNKNGKFFIAYKGNDVKKSELEDALARICPSNYRVKRFGDDNLFFGKIVYNEFLDDRDPYWNQRNLILTVNGYNQQEIARANEHFSSYRITDYDQYQRLTNFVYCDEGPNIFKRLSPFMHFCSVIYDARRDKLIAGVTEPNSDYTHLYYGYTRENGEVMFSNNRFILDDFCEDIKEMEPNTYMIDNTLYKLDGEKISDQKQQPLIKKTRENTETFFDGLNALLMQITDETIRSKLEDTVNKYLDSDEPKERIIDYLTNELDAETQKSVLSLIKTVLEEHDIKGSVEEQLKDSFDETLEKYTSSIQVPVVHIVKLKDTVLGQTNGGYYHEKFEQILSQVQLDEPIMLIGPAGSGKNVAISQVADALGLHMYYTNNASNEFKLTGFIDAGGNYRDTEFYKAFKNGGIFFLDEIDNSDPSALIVINSALANGYMAFPHETIDRHPDFRIIAAANTWGKGADLQYVGRNALDAATLDRFDNIFFDYDTNLEQALYPNEEVLQFMWSFRNAVYQTKIPHIVSTRGIGKVYKKEINGIPVNDILTSNVIKNLGQDDVNTIIGNMRNINFENKYYNGVKQLRLHR